MICLVAPISLYSTVTHNTARIKSHRSYTIEQVINTKGEVQQDKILVNKQIYDLYDKTATTATYIRGRYILYQSKGRYYLKRVGDTHTARLNCKKETK